MQLKIIKKTILSKFNEDISVISKEEDKKIMKNNKKMEFSPDIIKRIKDKSLNKIEEDDNVIIPIPFLNTIIENLDTNFEWVNSEKFLELLPQYFVINITKKNNRKSILNMSFEEIITIESFEENKKIEKEIDNNMLNKKRYNRKRNKRKKKLLMKKKSKH